MLYNYRWGSSTFSIFCVHTKCIYYRVPSTHINVPLKESNQPLFSGLLPSDFNVIDVFTDKTKKGQAQQEVNSKHDLCFYGAHQAFPVDYEHSNYEITHLLSPEIAGGSVSKRISSLTLTNTVPLHISLVTVWRQALRNIRVFASDYCRIPVSSNAQQTKNRRLSYSEPEVYTISGAVRSTDPEVLLNDRVNVPYLLWVGACCVRGAEASSFSMYVRNDLGGQVVIGPVAQLEVMLSDLYGAGPHSQVKVFPAYNGICSDIQHDVSESFQV